MMKSKTTITLSIAAIAVRTLLFCTGPIVGNQQALAYGWGGWHGGGGWHHGWHGEQGLAQTLVARRLGLAKTLVVSN